MPANVDALTRLISDEIIKALGIQTQNPVAAILRPIFQRGTRRFSELFALADDVVGREGFAAGARTLIPHLVSSVEIIGKEKIPKHGPLVVASNHPGTADSVLITSGVDRPDFKIVAGAIPFLQNLKNISKYLIFTPETDPHSRMNVIRNSIRHLEQGGSLLLFAHGKIDPDPAFMPNADENLQLWSRSLEIFLSSVPETRVLVTVVSGVLHPRFMRHPITWFRRSREDRQRLAMMAQVIQQMLGRKFDIHARVTFGELFNPINAVGKSGILPEIIASARKLLVSHLQAA